MWIKEDINKTLTVILRDSIGLLRGPGGSYLVPKKVGSTGGLFRGS